MPRTSHWKTEFVKMCSSSVAETEQGVALAILRGNIDFKREPWPQVSDSAKSLVRQMLEQDTKKRLTAQQVLGKAFYVSVIVFELKFFNFKAGFQEFHN